jgi:hypothetical protein
MPATDNPDRARPAEGGSRGKITIRYPDVQRRSTPAHRIVIL